VERLKAVIFDVDGVLIHSDKALYELSNYVLEQYDFPTHPYEFIMNCAGMEGYEWIKNLLPPEKRNDRIIYELRECAFKNYSYFFRKYSYLPYDLIIILAELKRDYKLGVATNNSLRGWMIVKNTFNIWDIFDYIQISNGIIKPKPYPDMLLRVLEKLEVMNYEAVYVGDSEIDVLAAKNAGIKMVMVGDRRTRIEPDYRISELKELKRVLYEL